MRSKTLLVSNIIATIYAIGLLWIFVGNIIYAGVIDYIDYWQQYFYMAFELVGFNSVSVNIIYAIVILYMVHIFTFTFGAFMGWIGYLAKKSGLAKFAATLYLIGTICFPIYIIFGLPITIVGFVGGEKQKEINLISLYK